MRPLPDLQCCVCLRICWHREDAETQEAWKPCAIKLETSHGLCPRCCEREMAKLKGLEARANV